MYHIDMAPVAMSSHVSLNPEKVTDHQTKVIYHDQLRCSAPLLYQTNDFKAIEHMNLVLSTELIM